jgi:uncharacterized integral membrane protein
MTAAQNHRYRHTSNNGRPTPAGPAVPPSRADGLWAAAVGFAGVLLLLIFVLQNGRWVDVSFLGAHGQLPLGGALLLAAVCCSVRLLSNHPVASAPRPSTR